VGMGAFAGLGVRAGADAGPCAGNCLHPGGRGARGHYSLAGRRSVARRRDRQVVRWLQRMALELHRDVAPSFCQPGHGERMAAHRRRVEHSSRQYAANNGQ
jgi:hypothetical protein